MEKIKYDGSTTNACKIVLLLFFNGVIFFPEKWQSSSVNLKAALSCLQNISAEKHKSGKGVVIEEVNTMHSKAIAKVWLSTWISGPEFQFPPFAKRPKGGYRYTYTMICKLLLGTWNVKIFFALLWTSNICKISDYYSCCQNVGVINGKNTRFGDLLEV